MSAGVEGDDSVGRGRVAAVVELIAGVQLERIAAGNGSESIVESNRSSWRAVKRRASYVGSQVDEAAKRTAGEGKCVPTGIHGEYGKTGRARLGVHIDSCPA